MELYKEILNKVLESEFEKNSIEGLDIGLEVSLNQVLECKCYKALKEIKIIIEDASLEDRECFEKIEKIVCLFEELGSDGGNRHDFG